MKQTILDLAPQALWQNFHALNRTPRPSHHEEQVQALLSDFGKAHGLDTYKDELGNIIIRKPATAGMEDRVGVILQGHLDMVPQANAGSTHNFAEDPIETEIEGDWVRAKGTTLGSDNGIGVAAAMAVLQSTDIAHGPIEALFTANEEDGMSGAFGLAPGLLQGEVLINMDSEDEGVLCIGCAGGANVNSSFSYREEGLTSGMHAFSLAVKGLKGGHSGVDIHRGRGNANKLIFRILREAQNQCGLRLAAIDGGSLRNAIPREAFAKVAVPDAQVDSFRQLVDTYASIFASELAKSDEGVSVTLDTSPMPEHCIDLKAQKTVIDLVCACPNGVMRMSDTMSGLVESSNNLAIVKSEGGEISVFNLVRSSVDSARNMLCDSIISLFNLAGANSTVDGEYPGWTPNTESPILKKTLEAYQHCFGEEAEVGGIHAGLECGILATHYPHWDMISFGPTIRFPHSPDEKVLIPSVDRFWQLLVQVLASIPRAD